MLFNLGGKNNGGFFKTDFIYLNLIKINQNWGWFECSSKDLPFEPCLEFLTRTVLELKQFEHDYSFSTLTSWQE